jgi:ADP-ribose pyrophosphatase YjhB (NUDIX family)
MTQEVTVVLKPRFGDYKLKWTGDLTDASLVLRAIESHLPEWTENGAPSVWLKLGGKDLDHLNIFLSNGFKMHRILRGNVLVLNRWLKTTVFNLPPGPFGYFGCGALVVNDQGQVLAIRENYKTGPGPWKLPGGLLDITKDKNIGDGAVRECFEETGVRAEFMFIAVQRFTLNSVMFHNADLYSVCRLRPLTTEIRSDPDEVAEARWIDSAEFLAAVSPRAKQFLEPALNAKAGAVATVDAQATIYAHE